MASQWLDIFRQVTEGRTVSACPSCGSKAVDYQYVARASDRMGYLDVWCTACNQGVHLSRVQAPAGRKFIDIGSDNEIAARIPDFKRVNPIGP